MRNILRITFLQGPRNNDEDPGSGEINYVRYNVGKVFKTTSYLYYELKVVTICQVQWKPTVESNQLSILRIAFKNCIHCPLVDIGMTV